MNTETDYLKRIAEEIANNKNTIGQMAEPDHHLVNEAGRLEKEIRYELLSIDNFTRRDTFHYNTLVRLVEICDILFDTNSSVNANVQVILQLLTAIRQIIPAEIRPGLRLPKAFILLQQPLFAATLAGQLSALEAQGIDQKLIDIAAIPFKEFIEPKHQLYYGNYTWLKAYERKLEAMDWENADCNSKTEALVSLLIASGLNDDRFFIRCKKIIIDRVALKIGRKEKLKELANCRKLVLQDSRHKSSPYNAKLDPLVTQLLVWITAEEEYVNIHEPEQPFAKLNFAFHVNKIAFLFKLLSEKKAFGDTSFQDLSKQIASTCTSVGGEDILAATIVSKAYPKKAEPLEDMADFLSSLADHVRSFIRSK